VQLRAPERRPLYSARAPFGVPTAKHLPLHTNLATLGSRLTRGTASIHSSALAARSPLDETISKAVHRKRR
jgi:hypothetical protein